MVPAGEGDGELGETLTALRDDGYSGFASLEPHLATQHGLGGFSGPAAFGRAARAFIPARRTRICARCWKGWGLKAGTDFHLAFSPEREIRPTRTARSRWFPRWWAASRRPAWKRPWRFTVWR